MEEKSPEREVEPSTEQRKQSIDLKRTQGVVNASNMINSADQALYPFLLSSIQASTGISLPNLGLISTAQGLTQSISTPVWGWLNDRHSRKKVLAFGCVFWGFFTILFAFSSLFITMIVYRLIMGFGLAVIVPTSQSIIADYFPAEKRGAAFGLLSLMAIFGIAFGLISAIVLVEFPPLIGNFDNWRLVFIIWGIISIVIAMFVLLLAKDPVRGAVDIGFTGSQSHKMKLSDFKTILSNKTFVCIVAQGVSGTIPWAAIYLMPSWFEYLGFTPADAGIFFLLIIAAAGIGSLFGGWLGDRAAKWNPNKGRIMVAQISVAIGIPMAWVIFYAIPPVTSSFSLYLIAGIFTYFCVTWAGTACNNPIFSEIFVPEIRGSAFSVDRVFEGGVASVGTYFVSLVATAFGFLTPNAITDAGAKIPYTQYLTPNQYSPNLMATNSAALAHGMFWIIFPFWILCLLIYTLVYRFYPTDFQKNKQFLEERAREEQLQKKSEIPAAVTTPDNPSDPEGT